jgi:hypothetical protein
MVTLTKEDITKIEEMKSPFTQIYTPEQLTYLKEKGIAKTYAEARVILQGLGYLSPSQAVRGEQPKSVSKESSITIEFSGKTSPIAPRGTIVTMKPEQAKPIEEKKETKVEPTIQPTQIQPSLTSLSQDIARQQQTPLHETAYVQPKPEQMEINLTPLQQVQLAIEKGKEAAEVMQKQMEIHKKAEQLATKVYEQASPLEKAVMHISAGILGPEYYDVKKAGAKFIEEEMLKKEFNLPDYVEIAGMKIPKKALEAGVTIAQAPPVQIATAGFLGAATETATLAHPTIEKILSSTSAKIAGAGIAGAYLAEQTANIYERIKKGEYGQAIGEALTTGGVITAFYLGVKGAQPPEQQILGRQVEEKVVKIKAGEGEVEIPKGLEYKEAKKSFYESPKWVEAQPAKEWIEAVRKGKIVKETPNYIIKEYKGYEYIIAKNPTGLPTKEITSEDVINVLRKDIGAYQKVGIIEKGKYAGMEVYVGKGAAMPIELPKEEETTIKVFKSTKEPRPILKELAESYKLSQAEEIAKSQAEQFKNIEKATQTLLQGKAEIKPIEYKQIALEVRPQSIPTSTSALVGLTTGFVKLEPTLTPSQAPTPVKEVLEAKQIIKPEEAYFSKVGTPYMKEEVEQRVVSVKPELSQQQVEALMIKQMQETKQMQKQLQEQIIKPMRVEKITPIEKQVQLEKTMQKLAQLQQQVQRQMQKPRVIPTTQTYGFRVYPPYLPFKVIRGQQRQGGKMLRRNVWEYFERQWGILGMHEFAKMFLGKVKKK